MPSCIYKLMDRCWPKVMSDKNSLENTQKQQRKINKHYTYTCINPLFTHSYQHCFFFFFLYSRPRKAYKHIKHLHTYMYKYIPNTCHKYKQKINKQNQQNHETFSQNRIHSILVKYHSPSVQYAIILSLI